MDSRACFQDAGEIDVGDTMLPSVHNSGLVRGVFTDGDLFFDAPKSCFSGSLRFARFLWITLLILRVEWCRSRAQQGFRRFASKKGSFLTLYKSTSYEDFYQAFPQICRNLPTNPWITVYVHKQGLQRKFSA